MKAPYGVVQQFDGWIGLEYRRTEPLLTREISSDQPLRAGLAPARVRQFIPDMPIDKRLYDEMVARREAEHVDASRDRRWSMIRSGLMCLVWALLGLLCYGCAFHTTDPGAGEIFRWGAYVVTYGGVSWTLLRAYRKGEERGDW